ncbi:hypothetical protein EX30DRAFT_99851 [Ascodesmis nigricans]|uniref:Uncharacterized protein n=1 Tax=Ascodesmis nigricans TaxID=341454 RepID=A0A4S2N4Q6_9PEZI|nr:hypothetical protein EX30DRAFT_99851 [Ascodesmis nigricans]
MASSSFVMPSIEGMRLDMTEVPLWKFSSYGPGKDPPIQLIDDFDVSPEEMRLKFYTNPPRDYAVEWEARTQEAQKRIRTILNDLPGALKYIAEAEKNRAQVYKYGGQNVAPPGQQQNTPNPFGTTNAPPSAPSAPNPFGKPSQPAFGQSSFGQPRTSGFGAATTTTSSPFTTAAAPSTPAFGQSSFGAVPGFGQSRFGSTPVTSAPAAPAFGQSSFGAPKPAFGQPAFGQSAFGQPAQGQATSSPFGAVGAQAQQGGSVFGQGSALGANAPKPAFGQSTFGQPSGFGQAAGTTASPFASVSQQQQQPAANPFGQPSQTTSTASPFAAAQPGPSPFGQAAQQPQQQPAPANPFGTLSQPTTAVPANPFGAPTTTSTPTVNPFGGQTAPQTAAPNPFGAPSALPTAPVAAAQPQTQPTSVFPPSQPISLAGASMAGGGAPNGLFAGGFATREEVLKKVGAAVGGKWDDPKFEYTPEEMEAFRMPIFRLGKIPLVPPPMEMCTI